MAQLIEDLLEFSRATAQELRSETFNLTRLANEVINQIQQDIEDRDVEITLKDLGDCNSDPNLLKQVLFNLLWNAVKFTRPIKQAKISLERKSIEGQYVYVVSDNGVGFDSKAAERLFTVFQRFHQPDDFEGSGVGLAIVGRIIGRHGGEVWAESRVGHGATFFFTLGQANNSLGKD
jgi:light-regulated signal transduction histidine kinase (bacteriophytochrome)